MKYLEKNRQKDILSEFGFNRLKIVAGDHFHLKMLHCIRQSLADAYYDRIKAAFDAISANQKPAIDTVYDNGGGHTPLHVAVFYLEPREVEILLNMGADINIKNIHGETPLIHHLRKIDHWFVLNVKEFHEVLEILLYENPDVQLHKTAVEDAIKMDEFF